MKMKCLKYHCDRLKPGDVVEIDQMKVDKEFAGFIKVRVVGVWSRPKWLAISFFLDYAELHENWRGDL